MLSLLKGKTRPAAEQLAWYWSGNRAVRQGDWKVVWDSKVKTWELYNIKQDRTENFDLAMEDPARVARMAQDWFEWADLVGLNTKKFDGRPSAKESR